MTFRAVLGFYRRFSGSIQRSFRQRAGMGVSDRFGGFGGHIVFVMLGEDFGGRENSGFTDLALSDSALPFYLREKVARSAG